jgi:hypothetical protein
MESRELISLRSYHKPLKPPSLRAAVAVSDHCQRQIEGGLRHIEQKSVPNEVRVGDYCEMRSAIHSFLLRFVGFPPDYQAASSS